MMKRVLKEPLLHFLLLGAGLFLIYGRLNPEAELGSGEEDARTIVVDEASLLEFMQNRANMFDPERFREELRSMETETRDRLIEEFVREEALYREALATGLEADDYVIKRRLVQKSQFITESLARNSATITDEELEIYFAETKARYFVKGHVTFTHVFFDSDKRGLEEAKRLAEEKLAVLNEESVTFDAAIEHGDRFPFHLNYVERTAGSVRTHFGEDMAGKVFALEPSDVNWHGPYESSYGYHLVMLVARAEGRDATLDEIRGRVHEDAILDKKDELIGEAVDELVAAYDVQIVYPTEVEIP